MEQQSETQIEQVAETAQVETEEQKTKRRVPSYFLLVRSEEQSNYCGVSAYHFDKFETKKDLKEFLEENDFEKSMHMVILGHEVPITFNKVVKVDF